MLEEQGAVVHYGQQAENITADIDLKRGTTRRIIGDACRMVVTAGRRAVSDNPAGKPFGDLFETVNVAAYDQRAVSGQELPTARLPPPP